MKTVNIEIHDPVWAEVKTGKELLKPCLSYPKERWQQKQFGRKMTIYRKQLFEGQGRKLFLTGFIPKIEKYCEIQNIKLTVIDNNMIKPLLTKKEPKIESLNIKDGKYSFQYELIKTAIKEQRGIIKAATASGKTIIMLGLLSCYPKKKILFLSDTYVPITQFKKELEKRKFSTKNITITTIQSLYRKNPNEYDKYDIILIDECFHSKTKIKTILGDYNINKISRNDLIFCQSGISKVTNTFKNKIPLSKITKITLSNSKVIYCSANHLFLTNKNKWIKAKNLTDKKILDYSFNKAYTMSNIILFLLKELLYEKNINRKKLFALWKNLYCSKLESQSKILLKKMRLFFQKIKNNSYMFMVQKRVYAKKSASKILLSPTCDYMEKRKNSSRRNSRDVKRIKKNAFRKNEDTLQKRSNLDRKIFKKDETKQSYVKSQKYRKNDKHQKNKWNLTYLEGQAWWQWSIYAITSPFIHSFRLAHGSSSSFSFKFTNWPKKKIHNKQIITNMLQDRHRKQKTENRNRNRWKWSSIEKCHVKRSQKRNGLKPIRVENIEVYKQGSNDQSFNGIINDKERNQGFIEFYDLEIETDHTYFANNILVHNCHSGISSFTGMYAKVLKNSLAAIRLGFTATLPTTLEAKLALEGLLGPVVGELSIQEGMERGVLAIPKIIIKEIPENPLLKQIRGYQQVYKKAVVENKIFNRIICKDAKEEIDQDKTVLILVVEIQHGINLVKMAKELFDFDLIFVRGSTEAEAREKIRLQMENKKIKAAVATAVFRKALNIPSLNTIINGCGGKSEVMTLQAIGRGLRKTDDKEFVKIIDYFNPNHRYLVDHFGRRLCLYFRNKWL